MIPSHPYLNGVENTGIAGTAGDASVPSHPDPTPAPTMIPSLVGKSRHSKRGE